MQLIEALLDLCKNQERAIIAIDGPAGAGKSTLASTIAMALSSSRTVRVIHMDELYNGWDSALSTGLTEKLREIIESHNGSSSFEMRRFNWISYSYGAPETLGPVEVLILEGVGSGQSSVRTFLSTLIWMDIDPKDGLHRVLARDGEDIEDQMVKWLKMQAEHFAAESTRENSDFIFSTN